MQKICGFFCWESQVPASLEPKIKQKMEYLIRHQQVRRFLIDYLPNDFFLFVLHSLRDLKQKYRFLSVYLTVLPWHLNHFAATGLLPDFRSCLNVDGKYSSYQYWSDWEPNYILVYDPQDYDGVQDLPLPPPTFPYSTPIYLSQQPH